LPEQGILSRFALPNPKQLLLLAQWRGNRIIQDFAVSVYLHATGKFIKLAAEWLDWMTG